MHDGAAGEIERTAHQRRDARHGHIGQKSAAPHPCGKAGYKQPCPTRARNSAIALNFIRSANAPQISAGVMMKNMPWKSM